jgi:ABC-type transport system involved in multi-copper enzyme maturation permease subunit
MAVFDRTYSNYDGPTTSRAARLLIAPRYAAAAIFQSRRFTAFYVVCLFIPFLAALFIYFRYNVAALRAFGITGLEMITVGAPFFHNFIGGQLHLATMTTLFVSPSLISSDLRANALPLYLARPFSRLEYVAGKMLILFILLSFITWIPGLALFVFQAGLAGSGWAAEHWRIAPGIFIGGWLWIILLGFLALACSALFQRKVTIMSALIALLYAAQLFANQINRTFQTGFGSLLSLQAVNATALDALFSGGARGALSVEEAAGVWLFAILACCEILRRRLRAYDEA